MSCYIQDRVRGQERTYFWWAFCIECVGSGCRKLVRRVWLRLAGMDIKSDKSEGAEDLEGGERRVRE